jgi:hypothetical protein
LSEENWFYLVYEQPGNYEFCVSPVYLVMNDLKQINFAKVLYNIDMKKPVLVKTELDQSIAELVAKTGHKILVTWACDCAERVLPFFEQKYPGDDRPRVAIETGRTWVSTGVFRMAVIRKASLGSHAAARGAEEYSPARSAARSAGQAVASAHVGGHSIAAAIYAATAIRDSVDAEKSGVAVMQEREWQYQHLLNLGQ